VSFQAEILQKLSKNSIYCKNKWYKLPYQFISIPEDRSNGQYMVEKPLENWGNSFHIEFEFLWTNPVHPWENIFMVDG